MINSQIPYNQLGVLRVPDFQNEKQLIEACNECRKVLFYLNGYMDALPVEAVRSFITLIHISDSKYSFDLEENPISLIRLFEAQTSENRLNDHTALQIFAYLDWYSEYEGQGIDALQPVFLSEFRKGLMFREKKEIRIKSYFTNLSLYTAPVQSNILRNLRADLDKNLKNHLSTDELLHMCLCHFQLRALAPYTSFNGHMARSYSKLFLREVGLNFDVLPLSIVIFKQKENYNTLMRDVAANNAYTAWCLFLLKRIKESADLMLVKLKQYQLLRKRMLDQLQKHSDYHLPAESLIDVLFRSPFIKPKMLITHLNCHRQTAYSYLNQLVRMGILSERSSGREKLYLNKELYEIFAN